LRRIDIAINNRRQSCWRQAKSWKTSEDEFDSMFDINAKDKPIFYQRRRARHLHDNGKIISLW